MIDMGRTPSAHLILRLCMGHLETASYSDITALNTVADFSDLSFPRLSVSTQSSATEELHHKKFINTIHRCLDSDPIMRPNIREMQQVAATAFRIDLRREEKLVDRISRRLEIYSESLENEVAVRTENLLMERKKCDNLLREILPK